MRRRSKLWKEAWSHFHPGAKRAQSEHLRRCVTEALSKLLIGNSGDHESEQSHYLGIQSQMAIEESNHFS